MLEKSAAPAVPKGAIACGLSKTEHKFAGIADMMRVERGYKVHATRVAADVHSVPMRSDSVRFQITEHPVAGPRHVSNSRPSEGGIMAISATEVINEQVLREVKTLSADLQEIKKSLAQLESSIAVIRSEVKALPTGLDWASEKRA